MLSQKDKQIVRELAKQYMEAVNTEKQAKMYQRFKDTNDLKIVRPPVLIDEIPWGEMNIDNELTCVCEDWSARWAEMRFRRGLFYLKHFKADNLLEPFFRIQRAYDTTGIGIDKKTVPSESGNHISSHAFEDILEDESSLELIHDPVMTARPDVDASRMEFYTDLLGDTIPIRFFGYGCCFDSPWDQLTFFRGVEPILVDMYDRPEYLHALMKKFTSAKMAELDFFEKNMEVDNEITDLHCTPHPVSGLASSGLKGTWYRRMAQSLGVVSPDMFEEFEVDYIYPLAERFAYTYYGCCESLDDRIDTIRKIPNLRKIGCSPWANLEKCAEQIGKDYVLARKPNPSNVALHTNPDVIREEIEATVKACIKNGCPYDYVLKDITTVSGRPENLIVWSQTVSDVLDQYYGKE